MVLYRTMDELVEVKTLLLQANLVARDAGHVEQVVDQVRQLRGLALDHPEGAAGLVPTGSGTVEDVEAVLDGRQRVAQLVREHRQEFILALIGLEQLRVGHHQQLFLPIELQEYVHLAGQDTGVERLDQEVHRARLVAFEHTISIVESGGHENDGDLAGALHVAHQLGQRKAIQLGHLDVDEGQRHLVLK